MFSSVSLLFASVLLCDLAHIPSAQKVLPPINVVTTGEVVLRPDAVAGKINDVTWKHNSDIALEWFGGEVTSYREFKGRTSLDKATGVMTIKNLIPVLSGTYTAEINSKIISSQEVKVFNPVPKPTLIMKGGASRVFTCNFSTPANAEPVELKWIIDGVEKIEPKGITIQGKENCSLVCMLTNPVSSESSEVVENPLCKDPDTPTGVVVLFFFLSVALLVIICFVVLFVLVVKTPPALKDSPRVKKLQTSTLGKKISSASNSLTVRCHGAATQGEQDDSTVENGKRQNDEHDPMIKSQSETNRNADTKDSSAKSGAKGASDSNLEDEKSAPEEDQN